MNIEFKELREFNLSPPLFYCYEDDLIFMVYSDNQSPDKRFRTMCLNVGAVQGGRAFDTLKNAYDYLSGNKRIKFLTLDIVARQKYDPDVQFIFDKH